MTATTQTPAARVSSDARAAVTSTPDDGTDVWWWVRTIGSAMLLMAAVFVLATVVVIPRVSGATAYTILTGSMEPKYPPGTLVVSKPVDAKTLRAGQVITFNRPDVPEIVTHRIDEINYTAAGQMQIFTKGDNNNARDPWVLHADNVRGKLWYSVPLLGHLNNALSGKDKSLVIKLGAGALVLYALYAFGSSARDRAKSKREVATSTAAPEAPARAESVAAQPIPAAAAAGPRVLPPSSPAPSYLPTPSSHAGQPVQFASPQRYAGRVNPPAQQIPTQNRPPHYPTAAAPSYWQTDTEITAPIPVIRHVPAPQYPVQQFPAAGRHADPNQHGSHIQ